MVSIHFDPQFKKKFRKIKDQALKAKIKNQIQKIVEAPEIGKPMRFSRKGTRKYM